MINLFNLAIILFSVGLYITLGSHSNIKKLAGLSLFQNAVLWFYISLGKVKDAVPPILSDGNHLYSNPLPHVLMLTAIVVSIATLSVGIALVIKIKQEEE